jgi:hypothetical protein
MFNPGAVWLRSGGRSGVPTWFAGEGRVGCMKGGAALLSWHSSSPTPWLLVLLASLPLISSGISSSVLPSVFALPGVSSPVDPRIARSICLAHMFVESALRELALFISLSLQKSFLHELNSSISEQNIDFVFELFVRFSKLRHFCRGVIIAYVENTTSHFGNGCQLSFAFLVMVIRVPFQVLRDRQVREIVPRRFLRTFWCMVDKKQSAQHHLFAILACFLGLFRHIPVC